MHGRLSDDRAQHVRARDDKGPRLRRMHAPRCDAWACAILPRGRCGERWCGPERKRKRTLGQQGCAAVALHRAEHARGHEIEAAQAAMGNGEETRLA
ncbi:hypothetical protein BSLA_01r2363 [Burkholderia stabilis]|nr:hypothetical protein BSLA_01r2363 [Burkholderia stabilis]